MDLNQKNKQRVWQFWQALEGTQGVQATAVAHQFMSGDVRWHGPDPILDLFEVEGFIDGFWQPLQISFGALERRIHLFMGGASSARADGGEDGRMWVAGAGLFEGRFVHDYLSIPASGEPVQIRWGEFCRLDRGRIVEIFCLLDLVDLMEQAGSKVLPVSRGVPRCFPPPRAGDGIMLDVADERVTRDSLRHIRQFIFEGLNAYDEKGLESMGMAGFFHPDVEWYGPGGIGACHGFEAFEEQHQAYWLHAFPDRQVQDLDALFAEGPYSAASGWNGVVATHRGDYLGVPATGNRIEVNGLDFWKREGGKIVENWVFVDLVHLFRQMGVDLFARIG